MSWLFGDTLSSDNSDSPIGYAASKFQRYTDPISWLPDGIGTKYINFLNKTIPDDTNKVLEPVAHPLNEIDSKIDPLRQTAIGNNLANLTSAKPGDTIGLAVGSVFTGGALAGAAGAGSGAAGGAAAGGAAAGAGAAGGASVGGGLSSLFGLGGALGGSTGAGTALGTGVGTDASLAGGITGGAGGLSGFFGGPAAFGDAGLTGSVSAGGSGLGTAMGGDLGGALGDTDTGLFSGLLPGGGMSGTASGALGGGISGETAGLSNVGGASMGGFGTSGLSNLAQQVLKQQSQLANQRAQQAYQQPQGTTNYQNPVTTLLSPPQAMPARSGNAPTPQQALLGRMMLQGAGAYGSFGGY